MTEIVNGRGRIFGILVLYFRKHRERFGLIALYIKGIAVPEIVLCLFFLTQFITVYSFIIGGCLSVAFVLVKIISQGDPALIQPGTLGMTCHIDQHPVFGIGVVKP